MDIITKIVEEKLRKAAENGEFDNLPGRGKPLEFEDLTAVPPELRAGYKILKNSGVLPEELEIKKENVTLQNLINCCYDEEERRVLKKKLNENILRFNILMENRNRKNKAISYYKGKIYKKFD